MSKTTFLHEENGLRFFGPATSVTVTTNSESIEEIVNSFRSFLMASGFQAETVNEYLLEE